jgi:hypothetical protein
MDAEPIRKGWRSSTAASIGLRFWCHELPVVPVQRLKPGMAELFCNDGGAMRVPRM